MIHYNTPQESINEEQKTINYLIWFDIIMTMQIFQGILLAYIRHSEKIYKRIFYKEALSCLGLLVDEKEYKAIKDGQINNFALMA